MGFIESILVKLAMNIADRVIVIIEKRLQKVRDYERIYLKHDEKKNELIEELAQANTDEERDAILSKIYNSRPTFD